MDTCPRCSGRGTYLVPVKRELPRVIPNAVPKIEPIETRLMQCEVCRGKGVVETKTETESE